MLLVPVPGWLATGPAWSVVNWLVPVPAEGLPVAVLSVAGAVFAELPPEPVAPEPAPFGRAPAAAEPVSPLRACDAALTVEPATELAVDTGESTEELAGPEGGGGSVAACAWRENTSIMTKIPAARIANCTAR